MSAGLSLLVALSLSASGPADTLCHTTASRASLERRASPLDSVSASLGGVRIKVCYGRPSSRGRVMIGGPNVPFGRLWRTGANEPTMLHLTGPLRIAGVPLAAGSYSLYTVPSPDSWEIILNRSIAQWGDEGSYTDEVRRQEVGRGRLKADALDEHVETFTIRLVARAGRGVLILEWEKSRVSIPVEPGR